MINRFKLFLGLAVNLPYRYNSSFSFLMILLVIILTDIIFHSIYQDWISWLNATFGVRLEAHKAISLDFAPEIWGGVLAMVLSTLIIVIAIAAENTPKLIDLYLKDWPSLFYIWFLIISSMHAIFIMFYAEALNRPSSVMLNVYGFLFIASFSALPYVFYILLYSKRV